MDLHMIERLAQGYENGQRWYNKERTAVDLDKVKADLLRVWRKHSAPSTKAFGKLSPAEHEIDRIAEDLNPIADPEMWEALKSRLTRE